MSQQNVKVKYALASAYENLLEFFDTYSAEANCGKVSFAKPPRNSFTGTAEKEQTAFECMLYLRKWRWRNSSRSQETVDILIQARETINVSEMTLLKSSVRVNYFTVKEPDAKLIQSIRYDYQHMPSDHQHPLFHAQIADEAIELEGPLQDEFTYTMNLDGLCCFPHVRIPTSDMTLSSVLLTLAADHWAETFFKNFRVKFLDLQHRLPQPDLGIIRANLTFTPDDAHLKCSHWYQKFTD